MKKQALLFANLRSGRAKAFAGTVNALRAADIEVEAHFDLSRQAIAEAVEEARPRGVELALAFGGDGTIGSVVNGIMGKDMILGVIPAGTSNNFARSMGIRPGITRSVGIIANGQQVDIDVGEVNGQYFAHAAIMGLNVAFARTAQRYRGTLGRLSYPLASLIVYRSRRRMSLTVAENGSERELETFQLAILNSSVFGGPFELKVDGAHAENRKLRALNLDDLRFGTVIEGLPRIFFERHLGLPTGVQFDLRDAVISAPEPVDITLDGEIKTRTPARVRVIPLGLRVIAQSRERQE